MTVLAPGGVGALYDGGMQKALKLRLHRKAKKAQRREVGNALLRDGAVARRKRSTANV
jgi:hypothetical protein